MDVFDAGRLAVILDPTGAAVSLWQPLKHIGACRERTQGPLLERASYERYRKASTFYTGLSDGLRIAGYGRNALYGFMNGERPAAGMKIDRAGGDVPSNWLIYFAVNDCDGCAAEAGSLGGEILSRPMDIRSGTVAVMMDPQDAVFAVINESLRVNRQSGTPDTV
jgi:predicted enzyme related to lactoylglutathione lyase